MEIILLNNVRTVIIAEKHLVKGGFSCNIRPVPTHITSECGMCIEIKETEKNQVIELLALGKFEFTIHHII
ncbi:DUF3343 domain-containing protein [Williamwhitmania taraxaci]|uniref:Putative Se/S carrier protein-like domain-containing protein n=1 Tax=Williamwhitmania taraxaci TaxID=1640674 RepID=A0A1G6HKD1_9BACT|nr:DUF3343 domain-containing protein [Williamwhitmania taraxaci]SDB94365.1 Protein of unknown function [Williamwhitmania taraxaci]